MPNFPLWLDTMIVCWKSVYPTPTASIVSADIICLGNVTRQISIPQYRLTSCLVQEGLKAFTPVTHKNNMAGHNLLTTTPPSSNILTMIREHPWQLLITLALTNVTESTAKFQHNPRMPEAIRCLHHILSNFLARQLR